MENSPKILFKKKNFGEIVKNFPNASLKKINKEIFENSP